MMDTNFQAWLMEHQPGDDMIYKNSFWKTYTFWRDAVLDIFYPRRDFYRKYDAYVEHLNNHHQVVGTHYSKSIENPVLKLDYKGCTIVFRFNFYDYEIVVISPKDIRFHDEESLLRDIFWSKQASFYYQGFPAEYEIDDRYEDNKRRFLAKVSCHEEFYTFMYLLRNAIDANNVPVPQDYYGTKVWINPEMDALRKQFCLCFNCAKFQPGQPDHCPKAAEGYALCKKHNMAFMVTRCETFEKEGEWAW